MYEAVQLVTVLVVAVAMALSLAHALELPGKKRLDRETYYAVQPIYYPGFTIGGTIGEVGGLVLTLLLLFLVPFASTKFWLVLAALLGLIGMQAVYWLLTHPVNRFWVEGQKLDRLSAGFFAAGSGRPPGAAPHWTELRDRWEYSHVARAALAGMSFVALLIAVS